jgi:primosomal replication protein N
VAADTLNLTRLTGEITAIEPLRHTPAGLPLTSFRLMHRSMQIEAGIERQTEFEVNAVAMGEASAVLSAFGPGDQVSVQGFLTARRRSGVAIRTATGTQLILHITHIVQITD